MMTDDRRIQLEALAAQFSGPQPEAFSLHSLCPAVAHWDLIEEGAALVPRIGPALGIILGVAGKALKAYCASSGPGLNPEDPGGK